MNKNTIIIYDLETGGLDVNKSSVLSIGAIAVHPRTLEIIKNNNGEAEEFYSLSCPPPEYFDKIEDGALAVNKITREEISAAPSEKQVWNTYSCGQFKING